MGAQNTSNQTAFMGDVHDLARLVAAALLPELRALAQVDPPMSIRDLAEWTGWGESHIRDLVARKAIPFHNRALPAQGVCIFRATIVQLCTIFATFGA